MFNRSCFAVFLQVLLFASTASSFSPRSLSSRTHLSPTSNSRSKLEEQSYTKLSANNLLDAVVSLFPGQASTTVPISGEDKNPAVAFLEALSQGNIDAALELCSDDCEWDECTFYKRCIGKEALERRLRLQSETTAFQTETYCVDDMAVDKQRNTVGVLFHREQDGTILPNTRGCAMFQLDAGMISEVCLVVEPATRGGEQGLQILSKASEVMKVTGYNPEVMQQSTTADKRQESTGSLSPPEQYFGAWNRRDMTAAVNVFSENAQYEDTAFPEPFVGKVKLEEHLNKCADALPTNFQIVIDAVALDASSGTVEWHMENGEGQALPFTQGCSFYKLDKNKIVIRSGIDFIEPAVIKPAFPALVADSLQTKLAQEPLRWIPVVSWLAYMYIVFFSEGILPGANALQLEARTWEEVLNLSLNFFLVSPLLHLPFSPSVHPMLEGVFNLLLSWAAMFAGFLSDDRRNKPNLLPMVPIVVGMQFLTSAFLLPYLAVRSTETAASPITQDELPVLARVAGESPVLGGLMGLVGSGSILWFFLGRVEEYGSELSVRLASFGDLLHIDRVGSSFLVDLAIFWVFQGWLVDDDLKRRGVSGDDSLLLRNVAKYIPFLGLAAYLILRPSLPETKEQCEAIID